MKLLKRVSGDFLFGVLITFVIFALYFAFSASPSINLNTLNVVLILVLVLLTAQYAYATFQIVSETRKDRKIRHLEKRLENLYSPLKYSREFLEQFPPCSNEHPKYPEYNNFLTKIRTYLHLASPALRKETETFLNIVDKYPHSVGTPEVDNLKREFSTVADKIKSIVKEEEEKIRQELEELTS